MTATPGPAATGGSSTAGGGGSPTPTADGFTAPTDVRVALDCQNIDKSNMVIQLGNMKSTFQVACNTDYSGKIDILAVTVYSIQDCLKACASYNRNSNSTNCAAVSFGANLTAVVPANFGNCFLKTGTGTSYTNKDASHVGATLVASK